LDLGKGAFGMLAEYKTKTNIGIGIGLLLSAMARVLLGGEDHFSIIVGFVLLITGIIVFIWGCMSYAQGKGYHPLVGLVGLLNILGLLILVLLRDKHKIAS
jgi:hypothetical protein